MTVTNTNTSRLRSGRGASLLAKEHTVLSHICRVPDREGGREPYCGSCVRHENMETYGSPC
ncbi:hypothetical protein M404DRAFT_594000 [Pisolithus tinctorius Marx 270]|uniref:Uncharacterized protein n=1 Tax=Pisolithus tinctorius Marx 270 TaxID=870435 RepID=A0A0C3PI30_PISTI|nr:hypothetical protein M404DRAFT_594000 [Pisolithus tinctorius Marx 270]